ETPLELRNLAHRERQTTQLPFSNSPSDSGLSTLSSSSASPLFTRDFTLLCLVTSCYFSSFFFFFPTLPFYVKHLGGQEADAGFLIGISSLVSFFIKPLAGRWIDRYGRVLLMNLGIGLFAGTAFLHAWVPSVNSLLILRILYGIALGCYTTAA